MYLEDTNLFIGRRTIADSKDTRRTDAEMMYCVCPRIILLSLAVLLIAVNVAVGCGGGGRRSGWGLSGGPTYTFRNGIAIRASGSMNPTTVMTGVGYRFRRETGSDNDRNQTTYGNVVTGDENKCEACIKVFLFDYDYDGRIANIEKATAADVVLKAHLEPKNIVRSVSHVSIAFDVIDVYKTSDKAIEPKQTLSIDTGISYCPCLPSLSKGDYVITGKVGKDKKLHLDGAIYLM